MTTQRFSVGIWIIGVVSAVSVWFWGLTHTPLIDRQEARSVTLFTRPIGEIAGAQTAGQSFITPYSGLYRIEVLLHNYERANRGTLTVRLRESPDAPDLTANTIALESVGGETWVALEFAPLADSAGRTFYFQLDAAETTPDESVTALVRPASAYAGGTAFRNGQSIEGDLIFRAHFSVNLFTRASVLLAQLTDDRPGLWGSPALYVAVAILYMLLIVALARQTLRLLHE